MAQMTDDKLAEVVSAINIFDITGDGSLPLASLTDCLRSLGLNPIHSEVKKIADDMADNGRNETIEVDQFVPIYEHFARKRKPTPAELCEGIKSFRSEAVTEGYIQKNDLGVPLTCIGDKLTVEECNIVLSTVTDKQGQVNIEKLVELVMSDDVATSTNSPLQSSTQPKRHSAQGQGSNFQVLSNIQEGPND